MKKSVIAVTMILALIPLSICVAYSEVTTSGSKSYVRIDDLQSRLPGGDAVNCLAAVQKAEQDKASLERVEKFRKQLTCARKVNFYSCY